ncbi:unnamed protein product [Didymodactylos carnosus]|uniref:NAD(P)(+)--arginine ADP-ribosyltransferase n=1 Tax=Didymodactylos carnosus TaxID=1234261 RepID=A0A814RMW2_9BILA|nr:unnamed protein product [Didymodactylos carnosus]CAF3899791.1 unnamed protein product [Didymodactylos carnosus]
MASTTTSSCIKNQSSKSKAGNEELTRIKRQKVDNEDEVEKTTFENIEDITLLWLDLNMNSTTMTTDSKLTKESLQEVNNFVLFFTEKDECLNYIKNVKHEKIILVLSGSSSVSNNNELLQQCHLLRQIDSIFIFCMEKHKYESLLSNSCYNKVIDICTEQDSLLQSIRKTIKLLEQQLTVFSLYNHTQKVARNLTTEAATFIWYRLLKDALQSMPSDVIAHGRQEMLDNCFKYYRNNKKELENIRQFEKSYNSSDAIRWYTKDSFIYKIINKALRTEDVEVLYTFRFYIVDLCAALMENYQDLKDYTPEPLKLYRGVKQTKDDIQRLKDNVGSLISMNGFFSTTRRHSVAQFYAGIEANPATNTNTTSVAPISNNYESLLFEIEIDLKEQINCILADISYLSQFYDEEEVLFDLGAVFEIESVIYNMTDKYSTCKMKVSAKGVEVAKEYVTFRKNEMKNADSVILFGDLLYDMREYNKSQKYFENLIITRPDDAQVYLGIGRAHHVKSEYAAALTNYQKAYDLSDKSDYLLVAKVLQYMGNVHRFNGEYVLTHKCLSEGLEILERNKIGNSSDRQVADILRDMADLYCFEGKDTMSFSYAVRAYELLKQLIPSDHPHLVSVLTAMSLALRHMGQYDESLKYQIQSLQIIKQVLSDNHSNLGAILNNIGKVYYKKCDYAKAITYLSETEEIYKKVWPNKHQRRAFPLNHLGKCNYRTKNYTAALDYYKQALDMIESTLSMNHTNRAYTLKNIGEVYLDLEDCDRAADYFQQALSIYKKKIGDDADHREIAKCYHFIGQIHVKQNNYDEGLHYFYKTFNISTRPSRFIIMYT